MGAIVNGIACHGGLRPYAATFFSFVDYLRPALRMAALCKLPVIFMFTHDSIAVGEDGPTHQPIEQLASIRCMPGLIVLRPADAAETEAAWRFILTYTAGPVALVLTRQTVPVIDRTGLASAEGLFRGAYVLADAERPHATLIATGSEVSLALEARTLLAQRGISLRIVSMPSREIFERQEEAYQRATLVPGLPAITLEAGATFGWERYTGNKGLSIGIDQFGHSAPGEEVAARLGFTPKAIAEKISAFLSCS